MSARAFLTREALFAEMYVRTVARSGRDRHWRDLLDALEEKGWLARQAEILGGFEAPSEELEQYVLPYLAERGDWPSFLRHALVAAQLRGMAEALEEGPVLRSLAEAERQNLARALAARLPDPWRRARARAEIAAATPPETAAFGLLAQEIQEDLAAETALEPRAAAHCLARVVRLLAHKLPQVLATQAEELARRAPDEAGPVWRALAEGLFAAGELEDRQLWTALWSIDQARDLPVLRPPPERFEAWLRKIVLEMADASGEARWRLAWPAVEAAVRGRAGGDAWTTAARLLGPMPLSFDGVRRAWSIWPVLSEERWRACLEVAPSPEARVALQVARIGAESTPETVEEVRSAIERLAAGEAQLHLALRLLERCPREPRRTYEGRLAAVAHHLRQIRFAAPADDLRRFLDLVARAHGGKVLRRQVEDVLWVPESNADTLRHLAEHAGSEALLQELFERAEEYAAMAAESSAEGFELRQQVLIALAARLCVHRRDLESFEEARKRLLPEETDDLAEATAEALAAAGLRELAGEAVSVLASRSRQLRVLLDVRPPGSNLDERLSPAGLYAAVADPRAVADELCCLAALLEVPEGPAAAETIAKAYLEDVQDPGRRIEGLIDLARHSMAYQETHVPKRLRDFPAAVLPLKQALGVVPSDDWLLGVTPELVEVGARLGEKQAVAEVEEAWERIGKLEGVPIGSRDAAWLRLLDLLPGLLPRGPRSRRSKRLLGWLEARLNEVEGPKEHLLAKLEALREAPPEQIPDRDDEISIDRLEDEVGRGALDASDPRTMPLRRRLWEVEDPALLPALARATIRALETGGKEGGENALRWFVNAYLAPRLGEGGGEAGCARQERVREALERSGSIGEAEAVEPVPAEESVPEEGSVDERLAEVEKTLNRMEELRPAGSPWGRLQTDPEHALAAAASLLSMILVLGDGVYWSWLTTGPSVPTAAAPSMGLGVGLLFAWVCVGPLQVWALGRFRELLPRPAEAPFSLPRPLAWALAASPLWGWGVLLLSPRRHVPEGRQLSLRARPPATPPRSPAPSWFLSALLQSGFLVFGLLWSMIALYWLLSFCQRSTGLQLVLVAVIFVLHGIAGAAFLGFLRIKRRQTLTLPREFIVLSVLFLLPFVPLLVLFAWGQLDREWRRETLCARLRPRQRERWAAWSRLRRQVMVDWQARPWWRRLRGRAGDPERVEGGLKARWRLAARLKTCWVFMDAAALAWGFLWLSARRGAPAGWATSGLDLLSDVILGLVILLLLLLLMAWLRAVIRRPLEISKVDGLELSAFALGSVWALFAGLAFGQAVYEGDSETAASVLQLTGTAGAFVCFVQTLLDVFVSPPEPSASEKRYRLLRMLLFVFLAAAGMSIAGEDDLWLFSRSFVPWAPAWSAFLGWGYVSVLIPDRWRASRRRWARGTAIAPLGGLAVPLWLSWRAR